MSDWLPVAVEFVVLVVAALPCAEIGEVMDEFDRDDPFYHLEAESVSQRRRTESHAAC